MFFYTLVANLFSFICVDYGNQSPHNTDDGGVHPFAEEVIVLAIGLWSVISWSEVLSILSNSSILKY